MSHVWKWPTFPRQKRKRLLKKPGTGRKMKHNTSVFPTPGKTLTFTAHQAEPISACFYSLQNFLETPPSFLASFLPPPWRKLSSELPTAGSCLWLLKERQKPLELCVTSNKIHAVSRSAHEFNFSFKKPTFCFDFLFGEKRKMVLTFNVNFFCL